MAEDGKNKSGDKKPVLPLPDAALRDMIRKGLDSGKESEK